MVTVTVNWTVKVKHSPLGVHTRITRTTRTPASSLAPGLAYAWHSTYLDVVPVFPDTRGGVGDECYHTRTASTVRLLVVEYQMSRDFLTCPPQARPLQYSWFATSSLRVFASCNSS